MASTDKRVDAYIAKAAPFAQPILTELRATMHAVCPEVNETVKWGMPSFEYHGMLANMAAFKAHAAFGFWKQALIFGDDAKAKEGMGSLGKLTSVKDLPPRRTLAAWIKKAMALNEQGVSARPAAKAKKAAPLKTPADLEAALRRSARARKQWEAFTPAKRREYVEWIVEAKRAETREQRLATAVEWIEEGKSRNWKYQKGGSKL